MWDDWPYIRRQIISTEMFSLCWLILSLSGCSVGNFSNILPVRTLTFVSITRLLCSTSSQKAFIIALASCCITLLLQSGRRVLEANKQAGKPCRAGTYTLFLIFNKSGGTHPTYLNRMFFSGVKVNRNRALFLTSSCNFLSPTTTNSVFVFLALGGERKSGNLFNCIPGFRGANQYKHTEPAVVVFILGSGRSGSPWCPSSHSSAEWSCSPSPSAAPGLYWPVGIYHITACEAHKRLSFKSSAKKHSKF